MEIGLPGQKSIPYGINNPIGTSSLYQQGLLLIEKLYAIVGFEYYLFPHGYPDTLSPIIDPVSLLWHVFRLGFPLNHIIFLSKGDSFPICDQELTTTYAYGNACKKQIYQFILACKQEFSINDEDLFNISELYKDDTNVFVKVMKVVKRVLDQIEACGNYPAYRPLPFKLPLGNEVPTDNRSKVLKELLETERKYIESLETLMTYQQEIQNQNLISKDDQRAIFVNLDQLIDFQRRFLVAMEATMSLPMQEQRIGLLFTQHEKYFEIYFPFCSNYEDGIDLAMARASNLQKVAHIIEPSHALGSYLIKPVQRICKYPLILQELIKLTKPETYAYIEELKAGLEAVKRIADFVNEHKRRQDMLQKRKELGEKVDDWKGLHLNDFGALILYDRFQMSTREAEQEYHLYLFDKILLCCKEMVRKKKKRISSKEISNLSIKGKIFISSISGVKNTSNAELHTFELKVYWTNFQEMESFVLKCRNEEQVKLWKDRIDKALEASKMNRMSSNSGILVSHVSYDDDDLVSEDGSFTLERNGSEKKSLSGDYKHRMIRISHQGPNKLFPTSESDQSSMYSVESLPGLAGDRSSNIISAMKSGTLDARSRGTSQHGDLNPTSPLRFPIREFSLHQKSNSSSSVLLSRPALASSAYSISPLGGKPESIPDNIADRPPMQHRTASLQMSTASSIVDLYHPGQTEPINPLHGLYNSSSKTIGSQRKSSENAFPQKEEVFQTEINNEATLLTQITRLRSESAPLISDIHPSTFHSRKNSSKESLDSILNELSQVALEENDAAMPNVLGLTTDPTHLPELRLSYSASYSSHPDIISNTVLVSSNDPIVSSQPTLIPPSHSANPSSFKSNVLDSTSLSSISYAQSKPAFMKIKARYKEEVFMIAIPYISRFDEFYAKIERKIKMISPTDTTAQLKIRYKDEYDDFITLRTDEDLHLAFDAVSTIAERILHVFIQ